MIGGKTGTTQGNQTAAFGGITPDYAVSVMYFDPRGNLYVGGVGGGLPAKVFHDAMAPILANQPNHPFPPADPAVEAGTRGSGYVPPVIVAPTPPRQPDPGPEPLSRSQAGSHPRARPDAGTDADADAAGARQAWPQAAAAPLTSRGAACAQPSWRRTSAATRPPSARPATLRSQRP